MWIISDAIKFNEGGGLLFVIVTKTSKTALTTKTTKNGVRAASDVDTEKNVSQSLFFSKKRTKNFFLNNSEKTSARPESNNNSCWHRQLQEVVPHRLTLHTLHSGGIPVPSRLPLAHAASQCAHPPTEHHKDRSLMCARASFFQMRACAQTGRRTALDWNQHHLCNHKNIIPSCFFLSFSPFWFTHSDFFPVLFRKRPTSYFLGGERARSFLFRQQRQRQRQHLVPPITM